jgi:hypothetical protein
MSSTALTLIPALTQSRNALPHTLRIAQLSASIARIRGEPLTGIAINRKRTPPPIGTHRRHLRLINGRTEVLVARSLWPELHDVENGAQLKALLCRYVRLKGQRLPRAAFILLDARKKVMHAARTIA